MCRYCVVVRAYAKVDIYLNVISYGCDCAKYENEQSSEGDDISSSLGFPFIKLVFVCLLGSLSVSK